MDAPHHAEQHIVFVDPPLLTDTCAVVVRPKVVGIHRWGDDNEAVAHLGNILQQVIADGLGVDHNDVCKVGHQPGEDTAHGCRCLRHFSHVPDMRTAQQSAGRRPTEHRAAVGMNQHDPFLAHNAREGQRSRDGAVQQLRDSRYGHVAAAQDGHVHIAIFHPHVDKGLGEVALVGEIFGQDDDGTIARPIQPPYQFQKAAV